MVTLAFLFRGEFLWRVLKKTLGTPLKYFCRNSWRPVLKYQSSLPKREPTAPQTNTHTSHVPVCSGFPFQASTQQISGSTSYRRTEIEIHVRRSALLHGFGDTISDCAEMYQFRNCSQVANATFTSIWRWISRTTSSWFGGQIPIHVWMLEYMYAHHMCKMFLAAYIGACANSRL